MFSRDISILLVEDDELDVKMVERAFRRNKITNPLHRVANGEEALDFLQVQNENPGLILLDVNMPRMNGIEFLKIIKLDERYKRIPVIVLTTSREESDRFHSYDLGAAGFIQKPVEFESFLEVVRVIGLYWSLCEAA